MVPLAASPTLSLHPFILFLPLIDHQGLPTTDHRGLPLPVAGSQSPPALEAQSNFVEEGGLHMSALLSYFLISLFNQPAQCLSQLPLELAPETGA